MSTSQLDIADLSSAQRSLLELRLKKRRANIRLGEIQRQPRNGHHAFCSFAQERLWFLDQFEPENPSYNITTALEFSGLLNVDMLQAALAEVVRRHESLRTIFIEEKGQAVQVLSTEVNLSLPVIDLGRGGMTLARLKRRCWRQRRRAGRSI